LRPPRRAGLQLSSRQRMRPRRRRAPCLANRSFRRAPYVIAGWIDLDAAALGTSRNIASKARRRAICAPPWDPSCRLSIVSVWTMLGADSPAVSRRDRAVVSRPAAAVDFPAGHAGRRNRSTYIGRINESFADRPPRLRAGADVRATHRVHQVRHNRCRREAELAGAD
jgi:hypothetical protein